MILQLFALLFGLLLTGEDKVRAKVEEIGSEGRKTIKIHKIKNRFTLLKAGDAVSEYELKVDKNLTIKLFQYGGGKADAFKIGEYKFTIGKSASLLTEKDFNPRFLAANTIEGHLCSFRRKEYVVLLAKSAGAPGKAINYSLYHIFDVTNKKNTKYYAATSYYGEMINITDLNNDGKLDFLKVNEIEVDRYEMRAFEISSGAQKQVHGKTSISF